MTKTLPTASEPCPFCGAPNTSVPANCAEAFFVVCDQCGCDGPSMETPAGAVVAWDARSGGLQAVQVAQAQRDGAGELTVPEGTIFGEVLCHCSEDDGVPDVGVSVGLGCGKLLWLGELRLDEGGDIGLVVLGPGDQRVVAPLWPHCEWPDGVDILRRHVGPALTAERERNDDAGTAAIALDGPATDAVKRVKVLEEALERVVHLTGDHTGPTLAIIRRTARTALGAKEPFHGE